MGDNTIMENVTTMFQPVKWKNVTTMFQPVKWIKLN